MKLNFFDDLFDDEEEEERELEEENEKEIKREDFISNSQFTYAQEVSKGYVDSYTTYVHAAVEEFLKNNSVPKPKYYTELDYKRNIVHKKEFQDWILNYTVIPF